jgi:hypothetical protein
MALGENNEGPEFAVDEWGDVARVASILEDLADEGLITEAMVPLKLRLYCLPFYPLRTSAR